MNHAVLFSCVLLAGGGSCNELPAQTSCPGAGTSPASLCAEEAGLLPGGRLLLQMGRRKRGIGSDHPRWVTYRGGRQDGETRVLTVQPTAELWRREGEACRLWHRVEALRPETRQGDSLQPGKRGTGLSALQAPTAQPLRSALTSTRPRAHRPALPLGQSARLLPSPGSPQLDTELACCFPHTDAQNMYNKPISGPGVPASHLGPQGPEEVPAPGVPATSLTPLPTLTLPPQDHLP